MCYCCEFRPEQGHLPTRALCCRPATRGALCNLQPNERRAQAAPPTPQEQNAHEGRSTRLPRASMFTRLPTRLKPHCGAGGGGGWAVAGRRV